MRTHNIMAWLGLSLGLGLALVLATRAPAMAEVAPLALPVGSAELFLGGAVEGALTWLSTEEC